MTLGFRTMARASMRRCNCSGVTLSIRIGVESVPARDCISVSFLASTPQASKATKTSESANSSPMLRFRSPAKMTGSAGTTPTCLLRCSSFTVSRSTPSISTRPPTPCRGPRRSSTLTRADLPHPSFPTMPTFSPPFTLKLKLRNWARPLGTAEKDTFSNSTAPLDGQFSGKSVLESFVSKNSLSMLTKASNLRNLRTISR
mmetsp:Transcript_40055/g.85445  ORF Transcript_40055/g.85445 Transcript_40055/m.85445 type:complete len:201 (-) Transcript_40055:2288-2890(-)